MKSFLIIPYGRGGLDFSLGRGMRNSSKVLLLNLFYHALQGEGMGLFIKKAYGSLGLM